jgi:6-phosphogluconolactonase
MNPGETKVRVFADVSEFSRFAAGLFADLARQALAARGTFLTALSGGGTPLALYRLLALSPFRDELPWARLHFFWGDERCVPPEDPQSNYSQAWDAWLSQVPLPAENIHRAKGELEPPACAEDYSRQLRQFASPGLGFPRFDLVLLGLGADGHTASLFPGSPAMADSPVLAVTAEYQGRPAHRITLTPLVFNAARNVAFLAAGREKAAALAAVLGGRPDSVTYPAQRIQPSRGTLWWLVDEAAAGLLPERIQGITIQR